MRNFTYQNSTEIIFGNDAENYAGKKTKSLGKKVLLHYGSGSIKKSGLYDRIVKSLNDRGVDFVELGGVKPNPRLSLVQQGIELCRKENIDSILAVGGGSAIDSAKAISMGVFYDGDVWDIISKGLDIEKCLPVGVVLTIPAAGSETSDSLVITNEDGLFKLGYGNAILRPKFAIMNPELTYTLPFYQTACGVSDMMAHIFERYFTTDNNVDVTDRMCEAVLRSIMINALKVKENPNDYNARAEIMWAGTVAHCDILGVGRLSDWASHGIEHEISAIYDIAHGAGLSIVFPAWMKYQYKVKPSRFVQFAVRVMDVDLAFENDEAIIKEGIRRLEQFYKSIDLPIRLSEVEIDDKNLELMAEKAAPTGKFSVLQKEDIAKIYRLAL